MNVVRTCRGCAEPERRWLENGRPHVNLDPVLGLCVTCLAAYVRENQPTVSDLPFDAKAAAAGKDGD